MLKNTEHLTSKLEKMSLSIKSETPSSRDVVSAKATPTIRDAPALLVLLAIFIAITIGAVR